MKKSEPSKIENGSWAEWRRLVLSELNRLDKDISELQKNQKPKTRNQITKINIFEAETVPFLEILLPASRGYSYVHI